MKCMCAQTRPRFILSSERVFGGMEFEPMLTPREKSPLAENFPRGGSNPRRCGQRAQTLPTSYSGPRLKATCVCFRPCDTKCKPFSKVGSRSSPPPPPPPPPYQRTCSHFFNDQLQIVNHPSSVQVRQGWLFSSF